MPYPSFIILAMLVFLTTLLAILPSILRSRAAVELENLALRHQIGVLQRSAAKRPKLTSGSDTPNNAESKRQMNKSSGAGQNQPKLRCKPD